MKLTQNGGFWNLSKFTVYKFVWLPKGDYDNLPKVDSEFFDE